MKYNREGSSDIPEWHIAKIGPEPYHGRRGIQPYHGSFCPIMVESTTAARPRPARWAAGMFRQPPVGPAQRHGWFLGGLTRVCLQKLTELIQFLKMRL